MRSSIREFLCSEAMHYLGVPTTRAGSIVVSFDTTVIRDKFYDGNAQKRLANDRGHLFVAEIDRSFATKARQNQLQL